LNITAQERLQVLKVWHFRRTLNFSGESSGIVADWRFRVKISVWSQSHSVSLCPWARHFTLASYVPLPRSVNVYQIGEVVCIGRPFNCMETFTPCIFLAYFGDMFLIWGHTVAASCWSWTEFQLPKFEVGLWYCYFHKKITHLGFQALIRKRFRWSITPNLGTFLFANLGTSCIPYTV
jgi:hypothetical protein